MPKVPSFHTPVSGSQVEYVDRSQFHVSSNGDKHTFNAKVQNGCRLNNSGRDCMSSAPLFNSVSPALECKVWVLKLMLVLILIVTLHIM